MIGGTSYDVYKNITYSGQKKKTPCYGNSTGSIVNSPDILSEFAPDWWEST